MNFKDDVIRMMEKKRDVYLKVNDIGSYNAILDVIREVKLMGCNTCAHCENDVCFLYMPSEVVEPYRICGYYKGRE